MMPEESLSGLLKRNRDEIATTVLQSIYKNHASMDYNADDERHQKSKRDLLYHLEHLIGALTARSPNLFTDYQLWADRLFNNLGLPAVMMEQTSRELAKELKDRAPDDLHPTIDSYVLKAWQSEEHDASISPLLRGEAALNDLATSYLGLLRQYKRDEAVSLILEAVESGVSIPHVYLEVFQPVQYQIGHLWHSNQISVAEEHFFTAVTQLAVSQLYPSIFRLAETKDKRMIGASVEGELHELGIRLVTDLLALDGWDTHYLGANTPVPSLLESINRIKPDVICISASTAFSLPQVGSLIEEIRRSAEQDRVPILVGGLPFVSDPGLWKQIGADGFAENGNQAVLAANQLISSARR